MMSCLLLVLAAQAQIAGKPRTFSGGLVDSLRQVEAYQYGKAQEEFPPKVSRQLTEPAEEKQKTGAVVQWLIYLFVAGILLVVAIVVIRQFSGTTGKRVERSPGLQIDTEEDLVHSDFHSLATAAESENNWRLALRYQYLRVLQQLQHNNQIVWHPYKTDSDYLHEIKNLNQRAALEPLVRAYSFTWYGQKEITQAQYQRLMSSIRSFS